MLLFFLKKMKKPLRFETAFSIGMYLIDFVVTNCNYGILEMDSGVLEINSGG